MSTSLVSAQSEEDAVKQVIVEFFKAFHEKDTTALRKLTYGDVTLQSIGNDKEGKIKLSSQPFSKFLGGIAAIPDDREFKEELTGYHIQTDGAMANAWTPYNFYLQGDLSHSGVNSFQLFKTDDGWKIIYIIDTRHRN
ncbi:nuclear transport factor 2 family protein [Robertkochia solimangrovi]|uniref:nuclear transport factor 2 family protein n=1 Tax=Robertkochia solimangrovi TaxID=2213046 RepID=UPI0013A5AAAD|nr:nuclear transport factor 2 family protein [Robertkochia solimangrovi]TRZ42588.1 nuclear transport factor 2 family protein [Robertkochia solimangrovi]